MGYPPQGSGGGVVRTPYNGTYNHPNDVNEHDVFEVIVTKTTKVADLFLDFNVMTQDLNIKLYTKINGVNYREIDSTRWLKTDRKGFSAVDVTTNTDFKVTAQSLILEGAIRAIPYRYILET